MKTSWHTVTGTGTTARTAEPYAAITNYPYLSFICSLLLALRFTTRLPSCSSKSGGLPIYSILTGRGGRDRNAQPTTFPVGGTDAGDADGLGADPHNHPAHLAPTAAMDQPRDKFEMMDAPAEARHHRSWLKWAAALAFLVILGLGLGLGLGLPCRINGNSPLCPSEEPEPEPTSTSTPLPPPTGVPTLTVRTPWQIVLSETLTVENQSDSTSSLSASESDAPIVTPNPTSDPNVTLYDIDMFLHQNLTVVRDLRAKGMTVICYFSAGSYEPNRPDSWKFTSDDKGKELDGWPGEYWLDLNSDNVRDIMTARIEIAAKMNCSGIDPDNVDGYVSCPAPLVLSP